MCKLRRNLPNHRRHLKRIRREIRSQRITKRRKTRKPQRVMTVTKSIQRRRGPLKWTKVARNREPHSLVIDAPLAEASLMRRVMMERRLLCLPRPKLTEL